MKKIAISIVFTFGLISVLLTACLCKEVQPYWKPTSGTVSMYSLSNEAVTEIAPQDTVTADSLQFDLVFDATYISHNESTFIPVGNYALATPKCPSDGHRGLKHQIKTLSIVSNEDFDQFSAGQDLKSQFTFRGMPLSVNYQSLLSNNHLGYGQNVYMQSIFLSTAPGNSIERNFTITIEFEDGQVVQMTTAPFTW